MGYQVVRQPLWIEGKQIQPGVKVLSGPYDLSQISSHVTPDTTPSNNDPLYNARLVDLLETPHSVWEDKVPNVCATYCTTLAVESKSKKTELIENRTKHFSAGFEHCVCRLSAHVDDIIQWSMTDKQALAHYSLLFQRLVQGCMQLKPSKCSFFAREIEILGHRITQEGQTPISKGVEAILSMPTPTNISAVKRLRQKNCS